MRGVFALLFAASGAAALVYEVAWTRLLTLQLGHGVAATSTVLAAFMGGLAAGAAIGGRAAARWPRRQALQAYAGLELLIAFLALLLPFALGALVPLLVASYADGDGGAVFAALRFTSSLLLLALPAAAMGATFPVAARWYVRTANTAARDAGTLYAVNTIGAACGALAAGFLLLPALGLRGATWVAVALNALAAGTALLIASRSPAMSDRTSAPSSTAAFAAAAQEAPRTHPRRKRRSPRDPLDNADTRPLVPVPLVSRRTVIAALAVSGFASLSLQVVWTRLLALLLGPTTYAFSLIVTLFIAGIAIGAAIAARTLRRTRQPLLGVSVCLAASVALTALSASLLQPALLLLAGIVADPTITFARTLTTQALLIAALLLPMTVAFGALFPFAIAAASPRTEDVASDLGALYAVNTAGAITGALLAGFVLIPAVGLQGTLRIVIIAGALVSLTVALLGTARTRGGAVVATGALAAAAAGALLPRWDPLLLSSGAYKYASVLQGPDLHTVLTAGELLYYREGSAATVAVRRVGGTTSLAIDGKVDASDAGDMLTQRMLAHIPLLLHPNPTRVTVLGLGSGVTLGSALTHPLARAEVLEISPQVVEAAAFFRGVNHDALGDERTRLILGDGRTHLALTRQQYDVIISEPSNPWMAGIASLFTREFFQAAKDRLAPGGIVCQWAHTYDISTEDLQSIVATFVSVFPNGSLWLVGDGDVLLIGSSTPVNELLGNVEQSWQRDGVAKDLASVGAHGPAQVLSLFVAAGPRLAAWAGAAPIQTDDKTSLEFTAPRNIAGQSRADNAALLRALAEGGERPPVVAAAHAAQTAAEYRDRGWMLLQADAFRPAYDDFVRAVQLDPTDERALEGLSRAAAPIQRTGAARTLLTPLAADPARLSTQLALSRLLASEGAYEEAAAIPFRIAQRDPSNRAALEQLASILSDLNDVDRMRPVVARLRQIAPGSEGTHYYSAALLFMQGRVDLAQHEARQTLRLNPGHARAHNLLGATLASSGNAGDARAAFQASLAANPRDPATYTNLATLELQSGNPALATRYFAEALTLDPGNTSAREGLEQATRQ